MTYSFLDERWDEMRRTMARQDKALRDQQQKISMLSDQRDEYRDKYMLALQRNNDLKAKLSARSGLSDAVKEQLEIHRLKDKAKGLSYQLDQLNEMLLSVGGALRGNAKSRSIDEALPEKVAQQRKALLVCRDALGKIAACDGPLSLIAQEALRDASR